MKDIHYIVGYSVYFVFINIISFMFWLVNILYKENEIQKVFLWEDSTCCTSVCTSLCLYTLLVLRHNSLGYHQNQFEDYRNGLSFLNFKCHVYSSADNWLRGEAFLQATWNESGDGFVENVFINYFFYFAMGQVRKRVRAFKKVNC